MTPDSDAVECIKPQASGPFLKLIASWLGVAACVYNSGKILSSGPAPATCKTLFKPEKQT